MAPLHCSAAGCASTDCRQCKRNAHRDRYEGIKSVLRAALLKGKAYRCALTLLLWHEQPAQESTLCRQESVVILREQL